MSFVSRLISIVIVALFASGISGCAEVGDDDGAGLLGAAAGLSGDSQANGPVESVTSALPQAAKKGGSGFGIGSFLNGAVGQGSKLVRGVAGQAGDLFAAGASFFGAGQSSLLASGFNALTGKQGLGGLAEGLGATAGALGGGIASKVGGLFTGRSGGDAPAGEAPAGEAPASGGSPD